MSQTLSSELTFLVKFIVFPLTLLGFGSGILVAFLSPEALPTDWGRDAFAAGMFVGFVANAAMYVFAYANIKRVQLDGNTLRLSNFRQEAEASLDDVASVSGSLLMYPELVWLEFRRPTTFGNRVAFIAKYRFFAGWTLHPVVHDLRNRLQSHVSEAGST